MKTWFANWTSAQAAVKLLGLVFVVVLFGCRIHEKRPFQRAPLGSRSIGAKLASAVLNSPQPTHQREWRPDLSVLPYAEISSDSVHLFNIRDCEYRTEEDYDVRHFDRLIPLSELRTLDFVVVPFKETPLLAHTMLDFGLADGTQLVCSFEARLKNGQNYQAVGGAMSSFELMYVIGTERDMIRLRTSVRKVDVHIYPARVTPEQVQKLFVASMARANEIARKPEFYDTLTNNCTTNIVSLINQLKPGTIGQDIRVVLPGHSDKLAYDMGLLAVQGPFEQVKAACKVNLNAELYYDDPDFSKRIRGR